MGADYPLVPMLLRRNSLVPMLPLSLVPMLLRGNACGAPCNPCASPRWSDAGAWGRNIESPFTLLHSHAGETVSDFLAPKLRSMGTKGPAPSRAHLIHAPPQPSTHRSHGPPWERALKPAGDIFLLPKLIGNAIWHCYPRAGARVQPLIPSQTFCIPTLEHGNEGNEKQANLIATQSQEHGNEGDLSL
jgi:hypothetical protein